MRELARQVGVSASMISQIETARSQPSVSTLYAITSVLGVSIEDLFAVAADGSSESADLNGVVVDSNVAGRTRAPTVAEASLHQVMESWVVERLGPLASRTGRPVLHLDSGVTWELLGKLPDHAVEFLLITYSPGGTSSSTGNLMRHSGSEYGYLLEGQLILTLGFEKHAIHAGDSVSFDSTTPHAYKNEGTQPAVGVWLVVEDR